MNQVDVNWRQLILHNRIAPLLMCAPTAGQYVIHHHTNGKTNLRYILTLKLPVDSDRQMDIIQCLFDDYLYMLPYIYNRAN